MCRTNHKCYSMIVQVLRCWTEHGAADITCAIIFDGNRQVIFDIKRKRVGETRANAFVKYVARAHALRVRGARLLSKSISLASRNNGHDNNASVLYALRHIPRSGKILHILTETLYSRRRRAVVLQVRRTVVRAAPLGAWRACSAAPSDLTILASPTAT